MEDFQKRVVVERHELQEKIHNLSDFANSPIFHDLDDDEQSRINRQFMIMELYANTLNERIDKF